MLPTLIVFWISGFQLVVSSSVSRDGGVDESTDCQIHKAGTGKCVDFEDCNELVAVRDTYGMNHEPTRRLFRSRVCKTIGEIVHVCCAADSVVSAIPNADPSVSNDIVLNQECGFSTGSRIYKGDEITAGSHPWLAAVGHYREDRSLSIFCGGTLITRRHVLTAAHCYNESSPSTNPTHVVLGEHSLSKHLPEKEKHRTIIKIASVINPGYRINSNLNDIALLTLERDVQFISAIRPACLPIDFGNRNFTGVDMTVVGWGATGTRRNAPSDVPLSAIISVKSFESCDRSHRIPSSVICGRGPALEDACRGDSGGPLLYKDENDTRLNYVVGVVAFGIHCGTPAHRDFPGFYTSVVSFLDWITENIR